MVEAWSAAHAVVGRRGQRPCLSTVARLQAGLDPGGHVRGGESDDLVVFAGSITRTATNDEGEKTEGKTRPPKGVTPRSMPSRTSAAGTPYRMAEPPALTPFQRIERDALTLDTVLTYARARPRQPIPCEIVTGSRLDSVNRPTGHKSGMGRASGASPASLGTSPSATPTPSRRSKSC